MLARGPDKKRGYQELGGSDSVEPLPVQVPDDGSTRSAGNNQKRMKVETGLYNIDDNRNSHTPFTFTGPQLKNIRKNLKRNIANILTDVTIPHFNLKKIVAESKNFQSFGTRLPNPKAEDEPIFNLIGNMNVIVRDNTSNGEDGKGEILAIKVGSKMKPNPSEEETAIPPDFLQSLAAGLYRFLATNPKASDDDTQHRNRTAGDASEDEEAHQEKGSGNPVPGEMRNFINIHAYYAEGNDDSIKGIKLCQGPAEIWETNCENTAHLKNYLRVIYPLTQLTEKLFQELLPDIHRKYSKVNKVLPETYLVKEEKAWFGIWTSRRMVMSTPTDYSINLKDVPLGFAVIIPLGNFTDGDICFPSLGVKMKLPPGSILFLRSRLLPYYVSKWTGNRFSIVQYICQSVFDYYTEKTRNHPFPLSEMPPWFQGRYQEADVV
ncbi:hypothetical protein C7212DRAFT_366171 [Tuber magnatum]|uniref:Uncharacterized protein n=1 Tax=Tuber magnatum TaxID=42249 RepID=A0A317SF45_9PEZI|nr:hypothetical protein C7212DRAFT_366171 [Tuber magnatum]